MSSSVRFVRLVVTLAVLLGLATTASAQSKMARLAQRAAAQTSGFSSVIIQAADSTSIDDLGDAIQLAGGRAGRVLRAVRGRVAVMPNPAIKALADHPAVGRLWLDREVHAVMERTGATIGAASVRQELGYDGTGIGVAVIDSGVTSWHDDLSAPSGGQRVSAFVDFVSGQSLPYDDSGHGTHVAGIIAGNGYDSAGARTGIAPGASIVALKALDASGRGRISDVIAAFDYVLAHRVEHNIRIVNVSLSAGVYGSYDDDPLALAAKTLVNAGIVVVAAAGNAGLTSQQAVQYGAVTAPGNAPWVLTVGASSHEGTVDRNDDVMAAFSSRGPTAFDYAAKPDLVAPGVGIESLSDPLSAFYSTKSAYLLDGTVPTATRPYLSLSGTSMAAPVVSGTVALMLQAHPALTPNQVKAVLQYTARVHARYNRLTQGTGFLNAKGAVELSAFMAGRSTTLPATNGWSRELVWGNQLVKGGVLEASANAWALDVTWGARTTPRGELVTWGALPTSEPWRVPCADTACTQIAWDAGRARNVVWGTTCGGLDCNATWTLTGAGSAVTTTSEADVVVWGSASEAEVVVWGSADDAVVVWGSASEAEIVVWGSTTDAEVVVWGSDCGACEPVVWGR